MFCGIDNILQISPDILHIQIEYGECVGIFYRILLVSQNIVMDLNNVMCWLYSQQKQNNTRNHQKLLYILSELSVKSLDLKEGRKHGVDPSLRKLSIKKSLAHCVAEPLLKVGWNIWDFLFPPLKLSKNLRI